MPGSRSNPPHEGRVSEDVVGRSGSSFTDSAAKVHAAPGVRPAQAAADTGLAQAVADTGPVRVAGSLSEGEVLGFLKSFAEAGSDGAHYLEDHLKRFVETLRLVPRGDGGKKLLELGAAFHHLTPGFARFCGYTEITCTDLWEGDRRTVRSICSRDGAFRLDLPVDNFDVEKDPYPYEDASFDTVICCEILEHLSSDPMHMLREINRIVKPGGHLLLTTPNLASAKSLAYVLQGESPYIWGQYPIGGRGTDRHNREYTALEVKKILQLAGFAIETLATAVSWWPVDPKIMDLLAKLGLDTMLRGDNTLVLGRRAGPPQARWPAEFYHGGEVGKDHQQGVDAARSVSVGGDAPTAHALAIAGDASARHLPRDVRDGSLRSNQRLKSLPITAGADATNPAFPIVAGGDMANAARPMTGSFETVDGSSAKTPNGAASQTHPGGLHAGTAAHDGGVRSQGAAAAYSPDRSATPSNLGARATMAPAAPLRVLVANNIVPNHDRGGSCYRMMTLLKLMVEEGHTIDYLGRDAKGMDSYVRDLEALGIRVHGTDPEKLRVWDDVQGAPLDLARILRESDFDVAILVLWFWSSPSVPEHYLHEIRRLSPKTRIVVLSDDVHWLHDTRMASVTGKRSDLERGLGYRPRELEIFRRADLVAAITDDDAARMRAEDPALQVEVLPHFVIPRPGTPPGFEGRRDVVTVGAFGYHANVDAATWFAREVFPIVRESLPGVRFKIVGANPPPAVRALAGEEIEVKGWVPEIIEELDRCRVFVSAIRYGTGLKTKNIQAMGAGIPLVGTSISLEGSGTRHGIEAVIENDPRAFAEAVVRLYTDEAAWTSQARAGRDLALTRFGKDAVRAAIRRTLACAANLEVSKRRETNDWSITRIERRDPAIAGAPTASERFRARLAAHLSLANERMKAGHAEEALAELQKVLAHCGQGAFAQNRGFFSGIMCRFGDVYRSLGKTDDAIDCFREALDLDPEEDDAILALRELETGAPVARPFDPDETTLHRRTAAASTGTAPAKTGTAPAATGPTAPRSSPDSAEGGSPPGSSPGVQHARSESPGSSSPSRAPFRPRAVPIEGKRRFAFLCPAMDGDRWLGPLGAYLERFTPRDDVSLLLLGPPDHIEPRIVSWLRERAVDENSVADVVIVPPPSDTNEMPRFVAAADALIIASSGDGIGAGAGARDEASAAAGAGARSGTEASGRPGSRVGGGASAGVGAWTRPGAWSGGSADNAITDEAARQGIPVLRAGRDDLRSSFPNRLLPE